MRLLLLFVGSVLATSRITPDERIFESDKYWSQLWGNGPLFRAVSRYLDAFEVRKTIIGKDIASLAHADAELSALVQRSLENEETYIPLDMIFRLNENGLYKTLLIFLERQTLDVEWAQFIFLEVFRLAESNSRFSHDLLPVVDFLISKRIIDVEEKFT